MRRFAASTSALQLIFALLQLLLSPRDRPAGSQRVLTLEQRAGLRYNRHEAAPSARHAAPVMPCHRRTRVARAHLLGLRRASAPLVALPPPPPRPLCRPVTCTHHHTTSEETFIAEEASTMVKADFEQEVMLDYNKTNLQQSMQIQHHTNSALYQTLQEM